MFRWPPLDVSTGGVGVGPQVNKFEQVASDDHQMSVAGLRVGCKFPGLMSGGGVRSPGLMSGERGVPYHVTYPMIQVMYLTPSTPI